MQIEAAFDLYWQNRERPLDESGEGKDIYGKGKSEAEKEKDAKKVSNMFTNTNNSYI